MPGEGGYIKIHRKITDWEWYKDTKTKVVFFHLLLTANYKPLKWRGHTINRGERAVSFSTLAQETGLSIQSVRTAILHLESTGEVTKRKIPECSIISVKNYDKYQEVTSELTSKSTIGQQAINKRSTSDQHIEKEEQEREEKQERKEIYNTPYNPPLKILKQELEKSELPDSVKSALTGIHGNA